MYFPAGKPVCLRKDAFCLLFTGFHLKGYPAGREQYLFQIFRRVERNEPALGDDEYLLTHGLYLGQDVGAEDHRMVFAQLLDEVADLDDLNGVKADSGLVQNDDLRAAQKRLGDPDTLPVALGERANQPLADMYDACALNSTVNFLPQCFPAQALCLTDKGQIFLRRFVWIQRRLLREIPDQPFGLLRLLQNIKAADFDGAVRWGKAPGHDVHRGRFPRAVRPEKAVNVPVLNFKGQVIHRQKVAIVLG